ncbi:MAG: BMP family ABC transporter substrate-binding protein [Lachnospiraceae bacterium]|nr:BMP family ABC transporter substrate-binding protein [Lachnospiraceae bacterium]
MMNNRLFLVFIAALLSASLIIAAFAGCSSTDPKSYSSKRMVASTDVGNNRIGIIYVGDELEGWTAAHMNGVRKAIEKLNITDDQIIEAFNVPEDETVYKTCVSLIDQGCSLIFATSYAFEDYVIKAARDYPDVQFCHCSGIKAKEAGLSNYHNYFDRIFEARYVSGVAAGMELAELIRKDMIKKPKVGYVGAFPYAEVISGYTAFFLGVKSIVPDATMEVRYSGAWTDLRSDYRTAQKLIDDGCVLLSQHSDTAGPAYVCQDNHVPFVGFNIDMTSIAPDTAITSPTNDWSRYYEYAIRSFLNKEPIKTDWTGGYAEHIVGTTALGKEAAPGTEEAMEKAKEDIISGKLHVFDTENFTVNGKHISEDLTDDNGNKMFDGGYYHEGELRSAPSFDLMIDGISEVIEKKNLKLFGKNG